MPMCVRNILSVICLLHKYTFRIFLLYMYIEGKPAALVDSLNPDWVPSLNMGYEKAVSSVSTRVDRFKRTTRKILLSTDTVLLFLIFVWDNYSLHVNMS